MNKWIVTTPFMSFLVEGEGNVITVTPTAINDLTGLAVDKARAICLSRGWEFEEVK